MRRVLQLMSSTYSGVGEEHPTREDPITLSDNSTPTPSQRTPTHNMTARDELDSKRPPQPPGPHAATGLPSRPFHFRAKIPSSSQANGGLSSPSSLTSSSMPVSPPPPTSTGGSFRYYQPPNIEISTGANDNDSDADSSRFRDSASIGEASVSKRSGACGHCKSLKVKCYFPAGQDVCQRCQMGDHACIVNGRKKRRLVASHEELQEKAFKQDREIAHLIQRIDNLKIDKRIEEWLRKAGPIDPNKASLSASDQNYQRDWLTATNLYGGIGQLQDTEPVVLLRNPHDGYHKVTRRITKQELFAFFPHPSVIGDQLDKHNAPAIVTSGLISPSEVHELFRVFFELINPFFSILDPELHTPNFLIWNCHFLFTVICALASRYHNARPGLYESAMEFANDTAGNSLVQGAKSVGACQAYLLMAVYPKPKKKWVDDRSWLFMGVAFSLAQDLKLSDPAVEDDLGNGVEKERAKLNRIRTWLNCFCVDASHATQFGKMPMLSMDDYIARNCREWYRSSPLNQAIDVHLVAYVDCLRVMGRFRAETRENPSRTEKLDYLDIAERYTSEFLALYKEWSRRFDEHTQSYELMCSYRADNHRMINAYLRLVVLSFCFQNAVKNGVTRDDRIVRQCINTAHEVITTMTQKLYQMGMLRYGMEAHFLFASFAASFLLNLLTPKLSVLLFPEQPRAIQSLIQELIDVLRSRQVSLDGRHTPYLYARFLSVFLQKYTANDSQECFSSPTHRPSPLQEHHNMPEAPARVADLEWIDRDTEIMTYTDHSGAAVNMDEIMYQQAGGADMDFSMNNFVQAVNAQPNILDSSPPPGIDSHIWWTEVFPTNNPTHPANIVWPMATENSTWMTQQQPQFNDSHFPGKGPVLY